MRTASSQFLRARAAFSLAVYVAVCVAIATAVCTSAISCAPTRRNATTTKKPTPETRNGRVTATLGLELVRWFVAIDPKARRSALQELEASGELVRIPSPLARDGMLLFRVKSASLPSIAAAFEKAREDAPATSRAARRTVLGQAEIFTDLATVEVAQGQAFFSDGRAVRSEEGLLRLAMRGWCFPTVDAAAARLEFRVGMTPNRLVGVSMDPSAARERMTDLAGARVALELASDEALIILEEPFVPPEPEEGADPPALPPPTRAALLFDGRPFPDRALILVIEPRFADILPSSPGKDPLATPSESTTEVRENEPRDASEESFRETPTETPTETPPETPTETPVDPSPAAPPEQPPLQTSLSTVHP
jgi:hypothetical protein